MEKTVKKFISFEDEQKADLEYYRKLTYQEKLNILIQLIGHENTDDGAVKRYIRVYPITESERS